MNDKMNELARSYNEYALKNLEMMNKFYKLAAEDSQKYLLENSQNLFSQISSNMNYLMAMYNSCIRDRETLTRQYIDNMDRLYKNFQELYRGVCETSRTAESK